MTPRRRRLVRILLALLAGAGLWFVAPRNADLRGFDPLEVARLETRMWRSYYEKEPVALMLDLYRLSRDQYGFSPCDSVRIAWHAGRAARTFQPTKSRAEARAALPALEDYFGVVRKGARVAFDPAQAAKEELEWWQERRESVPWQQYAVPIARVTAKLYGLEEDRLSEFALRRAEAMDDRDRHAAGITAQDWERIEGTLRRSWSALKSALP